MEIGKDQLPLCLPLIPQEPHPYFLKVFLLYAQGSRRSFWRKLSGDSQEVGVPVRPSSCVTGYSAAWRS